MQKHVLYNTIIPNESSCLEILEKVRWDGIIISPFAPTSRVYYCNKHRYKCKKSGKYFNAKTKTIFHNSKISLRKWFLALLINADEPEIKSLKLAEYLNISQKTAWLMLSKIDKYYPKNRDTRINISEMDVVVEQDKMSLATWLKTLETNRK